MTHPAEFYIFSKSTKDGSTNVDRIDFAVGDGVKRALAKRETTCRANRFSRKTRENENISHIINKDCYYLGKKFRDTFY